MIACLAINVVFVLLAIALMLLANAGTIVYDFFYVAIAMAVFGIIMGAWNVVILLKMRKK